MPVHAEYASRSPYELVLNRTGRAGTLFRDGVEVGPVRLGPRPKIYELETALLCAGKPPEKATAHALLARELVALKRNAEAKAHLDEARKLDPDNAEARATNLP